MSTGGLDDQPGGERLGSLRHSSSHGYSPLRPGAQHVWLAGCGRLSFLWMGSASFPGYHYCYSFMLLNYLYTYNYIQHIERLHIIPYYFIIVSSLFLSFWLRFLACKRLRMLWCLVATEISQFSGVTWRPCSHVLRGRYDSGAMSWLTVSTRPSSSNLMNFCIILYIISQTNFLEYPLVNVYIAMERSTHASYVKLPEGVGPHQCPSEKADRSDSCRVSITSPAPRFASSTTRSSASSQVRCVNSEIWNIKPFKLAVPKEIFWANFVGFIWFHKWIDTDPIANLHKEKQIVRLQSLWITSFTQARSQRRIVPKPCYCCSQVNLWTVLATAHILLAVAGSVAFFSLLHSCMIWIDIYTSICTVRQ